MKAACIGIIGAMVEEVQQFQGVIQNENFLEIAGVTFIQGQWYGQQVVICKSGVGKVNAAMCAQILIDRFAVEALWFTGVAGGLDPALTIGDIVISHDCLQHDMDASPLGFAVGEIPFAAQSIFVADEGLVELALKQAQALYGSARVAVGRILSGDQFIADREKVLALRAKWDAACIEMEGAAVAQVCAANQLPFVIVRSISDQADGEAPEHFPQFVKEAAVRSCQIVEACMQASRTI